MVVPNPSLLRDTGLHLPRGTNLTPATPTDITETIPMEDYNRIGTNAPSNHHHHYRSHHHKGLAMEVARIARQVADEFCHFWVFALFQK